MQLSLFVVYYADIFFFKQKTAYEMRISDWSSDVCSSDLLRAAHLARAGRRGIAGGGQRRALDSEHGRQRLRLSARAAVRPRSPAHARRAGATHAQRHAPGAPGRPERRFAAGREIGRANVCTPVTNAHLVCRLLLAKKKQQN